MKVGLKGWDNLVPRDGSVPVGWSNKQSALQVPALAGWTTFGEPLSIDRVRNLGSNERAARASACSLTARVTIGRVGVVQENQVKVVEVENWHTAKLLPWLAAMKQAFQVPSFKSQVPTGSDSIPSTTR